ncbi:MAG: VOC family protein [Betaproteobacteria bacterium]|nr:VOC family protein [Betaproteobacteria bacterium]
MPGCCIDHIAVTAPSLGTGAAFVHDVLGVAPQAGGEHPRMGTHNLLLRLGDALFLEVIAPNPSAPAPARPRWFGLDTLGPGSQPALSAWVARTADIHAATAASSEVLGSIEPMSRGALNWLITIPADGSLPLEGIAPVLIEWQTETHPADKLQDCGLSLAKLELFHPESERVSRLLRSLGLENQVSVSVAPNGSMPQLVAHINTPRGLRLLSAPRSTRQTTQSRT